MKEKEKEKEKFSILNTEKHTFTVIYYSDPDGRKEVFRVYEDIRQGKEAFNLLENIEGWHLTFTEGYRLK